MRRSFTESHSFVDITGQVFGELTAISPIKNKPGEHQGIRWRCKCSCGADHVARGNMLRLGNIKSCGCKQYKTKDELLSLRGTFNDLTGQKFGRLLVLERVRNDVIRSPGKARFLCKCDCGRLHITRGSDLAAGNTKSCGCLRGKK